MLTFALREFVWAERNRSGAGREVTWAERSGEQESKKTERGAGGREAEGGDHTNGLWRKNSPLRSAPLRSAPLQCSGPVLCCEFRCMLNEVSVNFHYCSSSFRTYLLYTVTFIRVSMLLRHSGIIIIITDLNNSAMTGPSCQHCR